jgi:hypothetical protein
MFAKKQKAPTNPTRSIFQTWTLHRWGVDIVGPLPAAPENLRFVVIALEYFTKWIEAKALAKITLGTLISFVWQRIICRFWSTSLHHSRQQEAVRLHRIQEFLQRTGDKTSICISQSPWEQRRGWKSKWPHFHCNSKSTIGFSKRKVGTGASHFSMRTQYL